MDDEIRRFEIVWVAAGSAYAVFPVAPDILAVAAKANLPTSANESVILFQSQPCRLCVGE